MLGPRTGTGPYFGVDAHKKPYVDFFVLTMITDPDNNLWSSIGSILLNDAVCPQRIGISITNMYVGICSHTGLSCPLCE